jgi:hypothetical protein
LRLLILAEWDQDTPLYMAQEVFAKLTNAPYKRHVLIGEGTHAVAVEKNRMHLITANERAHCVQYPRQLS